MQASAGGKLPPLWLPPVQIDLLVAITLVIAGANIEMVPEIYRDHVSTPLVFLVGMFIVAGLAAMKELPIAFAVAFCLVNIIRIAPKKAANKTNPGTEGFQPAGTVDWVTTHKKWFVEKVLKENPKGIQDKEATTYPIHA
jgi:hypothetical protein